ncbi:M23 family metallopeptidase [Nonomuraea typhae]|uniref:M23 family metallopeptidase n=1 Tax=Nonomuraea typhae TaxID=2603600 RepID=UPI0012F885C2|nr:M23 family metallopeptidase [Nonomuraea typhae]
MPHPALALLLALTTVLAPPVPPATPTWTWPTPDSSHILRRFTPPPAPWLSGHRGVDLAASPGTTIHAAGEGTIGYAAPLAGRGVVTIHHPNGLRTTYLPVHPSVRRGQQVTTGTPIGTLQSLPTPHCQSHCLHWGLLRDRRYLDPLLLTGTGLIRLLPHWPANPPEPRPENHPPPPAPTMSKKWQIGAE